MIAPIADLPDGTVGFSASGTVTAQDYETVLIPAVEELFSRRDKVRFLYHLGPAFEGFETAAVWDDAKVGIRHLRGWERIAVVTDVEWIRAGMKAFGLMMPGHVRVFPAGELAAAKQWLAE